MEERIIQTDQGLKDGQSKCPKCGSTDISLDNKSGNLVCEFCRHEFEPEKFDAMETDIENLEGEIIASGASAMQSDADSIITLKCSSCGAEVVVDTASETQARCHWCRNVLSLNRQVENGSVPDTVLPFKVQKKEAKEAIESFVGKRKFFANPKFKEEFTTDNVMGVYLPYMIVDANAHASFGGQGEIETNSYEVKEGDKTVTYYDADLYSVGRQFDLAIEGLTVESSSDKLNVADNEKTNNIINSIMPFDTENCVKWDANYLKGYTSEKRGVEVDGLKPLVEKQCRDIAWRRANDTIEEYDRGVRWDQDDIDLKGRQWKSAYLPVWLYSYLEERNDKKLLHYVAVNARTKETMGSVPVHMPKLIVASLIIELICVLAAALLFVFAFDSEEWYPWVLAIGGIIYYAAMYSKYRNKEARHNYEEETVCRVSNVQKSDHYIEHRERLESARMDGANNA